MAVDTLTPEVKGPTGFPGGGVLMPPWKAEPYRLWSLRAMLAAYAQAFLNLEINLGRIETDLYVIRQSPASPEGMARVEGHFRTIQRSLGKVREACVQLGMADSLKQIDRTAAYVSGLKPTYENAREIETRLRALAENLNDSLETRMLLYVPRPDLYDQEDYFGEEVGTKFSRANHHIRESATCLAVGRGTASVFHAMCVLDVGLDSLSSALGLPYSRKNWGQVLQDIETKIKGMVAQADRDYYSSFVFDFKCFRDAWRNHTQHGRAKYDSAEAEKILGHVRTFMEQLATRFSQRPEPEDL